MKGIKKIKFSTLVINYFSPLVEIVEFVIGIDKVDINLFSNLFIFSDILIVDYFS